MDANVQVAVVSVFSTAVATLGVVLAALINKQNQPKVTAVDAGVNPDWDMQEVIARIILLLKEIERHEQTIEDLKITNTALLSEKRDLKRLVHKLQGEMLRLQKLLDMVEGEGDKNGG